MISSTGLSKDERRTSEKGLTKEQAVKFMEENGFKIGQKTFERFCRPSIGKGPEPDYHFSGRDYFFPSTLLAWCHSYSRRRRVA